MKNIYIIAFLASILTFACTSEEVFEFVLALNIEGDYEINDTNGFWNEEVTIEYADFADELEDIINEGIAVESVDFEGVVLTIQNQSQALTGVEDVTLTFVDSQGNQTMIYNNVTVNIPSGQAITTVNVTDLLISGVDVVKDQILGYANQTDFSSFRLITTGRSVPSGTPLNMDLMVEVKTAVEFSEELEVPGFLGN